MDIGSLSRSVLEQIEAAREEFEAAWREGRNPRIEDFLTTPEPARAPLLQSIIARDREIRLATGERPLLQEYLERLPAETELVRRAFGETEAGPSPAPSSWAPSPPSTEPLTDPATASSPPSAPPHERETDGRPPAPSMPLDRIGDFRPTRLLGEGGFGRVYYAWDEQLDRAVALKVARPGSLGGRDREEVLLAEARLAAQLRHPGIVAVYRVGRIDDDGGAPFVALEYVEGRTLEKVFAKDGRMAFDRLATLVAMVAEAIHHAHEHRVIHRDLKPANILIDEKGEPRVTDFGLAVHEEKEPPKAGEVAGTPSYMAPEQVRGESHRLDGRTDLWALGVILYQGLTGRRPFEGRTKPEIYGLVLGQEPRAPRQLDRRIPAELERICLKCLSKRMSDRHGSAVALAEDLRAWMATTSPAAMAGPSAPSTAPSTPLGPPKVAPKGLRAFDQGDAELFLALMPGPRGRDGVPDSVRAWQSRIDGSSGGLEPFSVGLLYGPSGGGKSSFVRAGLLPRLDPTTTVICLDATPLETEARLLAALRRRGAAPATVDDLPEAVAALRARGEGGEGPPGKVLIVLDQFEQWLQAHPDEPDAPLIRALRQCDGRHVQGLVLVRDEFWTTVGRFFRALEVPMVEGVNSSPVELPDARHARTVLEAFGRACDRFTGPGDEPSMEEERFLQSAVAGLTARDGRVAPIRLSLLAEVVRRRPWTPATLRDLGGVEGIGLTFLAEAFDAPTSPPLYRAHARAAGAMLQALLPTSMSSLKAPARPASELRKAAGYVGRPDDFRELIAVLDRDLRLISVVEPESPGPPEEEPEGPDKPAAEPSYQLAHDDLVEAIRRWVERKENSTRAGRARLRLASMAASYAERPERRRLPSVAEWLSILSSTRPGRWTADERRMMGAATRLHLGRAAAALAVASAVGLAIGEVRGRERANSLLGQAVAADPAALIDLMPRLLQELPRLREGAERIEWGPSSSDRERRTATLIGYLAGPTAGRADTLLARLPKASPEEVQLIRDAIAPHPEHARADRLLSKLREEATGPPARLRLVASLVGLDPSAAVDLGPQAPTVAHALLGEERRTVPLWIDLLGPALPKVGETLAAICADAGREPATRANAAEALAGLYARLEDPRTLAMAAVEARPDAAAVLIRGLVHRFDEPKTALEALEAVMKEPAADPTREDDAEKLASRKAAAAVAIAALGKVNDLPGLLAHRDDPRLRTRLIHALARSEIVATIALPRLAIDPKGIDPARRGDFLAERQALLMALAEADPDAVGAAARGVGAGFVASIYSDEPDAGVHSAAWLLLKRWHRDDLIALADERIARKPPPASPPDRSWIVGPNGHTFVVLKGPLTFRMGSPAHEVNRFDREAHHVRRIDRSLAVATTEVTDAQFRAFYPEHAPDPRYGTDPDGPARELDWFAAIRYCNWLSRQAGLEPCYPDPFPDEHGNDGVELPDDVASRGGFRLPTEAEWEFACRAYTTTSRSFGSSDELLPRYGWTWLNSENRIQPVARLLPNPFGLFDTLGNAWEWCHEGMPPYVKGGYPLYPRGTAEAPAPDPAPGGPVTYDGGWRMTRGGAFDYAPAEARSANRYNVLAEIRDCYNGLRIVRTLP